MKTSLICTLYNEAFSVAPLIASIEGQTRKPDEVIFVDAGSTDGTVTKIKALIRTSPLNIRLFEHRSNRSAGRNFAISKAKYNLIAATDAGCVLDQSWLERLTKPLRHDKADSVAGFYLPVTPTAFEQAVAPFVVVMPDRVKPNFLPSSRSIAFTKAAWNKVGGYPEDLDYCEDLVFATRLQNNTRLVLVKNALVYWRQSTNFLTFFHQIAGYATGDITAGYAPHTRKIASVFARYLLFLLVQPLFVLYLVWPLLRHYRYLSRPAALIYTPFLQLVSDAAVIFGTLSGLKTRFGLNHSPNPHLKPRLVS